MLVVKNLPANAGDVRDVGLIPGWGRSPGGGHGNPLHYSCMENPMDREAWRATVHRVAKSQTRLKWIKKSQEEIYLKSLKGPKEVKSANPKENQPWVFIGRIDAESKILILWPLDVKSQFIGKDPDGGKDRRQEEKEMTEDEMVGWHHRLNWHEFEQALGDGEGQEAWRAAVHGITKSLTWLSDWTTKC